MPRTTNPLPQLIPGRFDQLKQRLWGMIWSRSSDLAVEAGPVNDGFAPLAEAMQQRFAPIAPGTRFAAPTASNGGPMQAGANPANAWCNRWMRIDLPAAAADELGLRHLDWSCHGETTVFIDGQPWAGLDAGHATCPLPDRACTLWLDVALYNTGIWVPGFRQIGRFGVEFDGASVKRRDQLAWDCHFDVEAISSVIGWLLNQERVERPASGFGNYGEHRRVSPLLRRLLREADACYDAWVAGGLAALRQRTQRVFRDFPAETWQPLIHALGHSHLDLVWLWPESATERKGVHTMATQLRLMERYPEFRFTQSQPALYRALERQAPGQFNEIRRHIANGRWEVLGGFEVEPDNNLPCGEALARSLVHGQAKIAELTGKPSTICWLPDVFGYAACLPQILKLGGVTAFFTTKLSWSAITHFPYTTFVWKGNDGSVVDAHLMPGGYNGTAEAASNNDLVREHDQVDVHPAMIAPIGYGDGGGGPNEPMCERIRRAASLAGAARHEWSSGARFFAEVAAVRDQLPVYQGELYLEYHRGTYTTQSDFKALYRGLERALQLHEAARVITGGGGLDGESWRRLAFAQFHDAIPGSSIGKVYEQLNAELRQRGAAELAAAVALFGQPGTNGSATVVNPLPLARTTVVAIPGIHPGLSVDGRPAAVQPDGQGNTLVALTVAGLGAAQVRPGPAVPAAALRATATRLDNGLVQAAFDANGQLRGLRIEDLDLPLEAAAGLRLYHDHPQMFDAWDIDHDVLKRGRPVAEAVSLSVIEAGPLRAILRGSAKLGDQSSLTIDYAVEADSPWLLVTITIDWRERHRLLKYHLPTAYRGRMARFGAPFGSVERPQLPGNPQDEAMWEVPMQRWAAVVDDAGTGLAVLSEAKYGVSVKEGDLGLSLLRSPTDPDPEADQGRHVLRFAIGRHRATTEGTGPSTAAAADSRFTPALVTAVRELPVPPVTWTAVGSLVPSWVEPIVDGMILRAHETDGRRGIAELELAAPAKRVELVDFLGKIIGMPERRSETRFGISYGAYQIVSVRVIR